MTTTDQTTVRNAYRLEPIEIEGVSFKPGDRVILTEAMAYDVAGQIEESHTYNATVVGRLDTTGGSCIVVDSDDDGEIVLSIAGPDHVMPDVVAIDLIVRCDRCGASRKAHDPGDLRMPPSRAHAFVDPEDPAETHRAENGHSVARHRDRWTCLDCDAGDRGLRFDLTGVRTSTGSHPNHPGRSCDRCADVPSDQIAPVDR